MSPFCTPLQNNVLIPLLKTSCFSNPAKTHRKVGSFAFKSHTQNRGCLKWSVLQRMSQRSGWKHCWQEAVKRRWNLCVVGQHEWEVGAKVEWSEVDAVWRVMLIDSPRLETGELRTWTAFWTLCGSQGSWRRDSEGSRVSVSAAAVFQ